MPENSCKNGLVCVADMAVEMFFVFLFFSDGRIYPPYITYLAVVVFLFGIPEFCFACETKKKKKKKKCCYLQQAAARKVVVVVIDDDDDDNLEHRHRSSSLLTIKIR